MNDAPHLKPDVREMKRLLHENVPHTSDRTQLYQANDISLVRRLSSQLSMLTGLSSLRPDISLMLNLLTESLPKLGSSVFFEAVGTVQHVGNGVATLSGLPKSQTYELVTFPTGVQGMILNLDQTSVDVILLGPSEGIQGGDLVTATGEQLKIAVGHNILGRIVDPLATPLDDRGPIESTEYWFMERQAPGIIDRAPVNVPLQTGWKMIDALVPIGRGQRELIIGDRQTGKTTLAVDTIINQQDKGVACFYVAIGQKKSTTLGIIESLQRAGAMEYTTVVLSSPDDPPALRYLAPYAGCTMAESIMQEGRDVLIVYDDLTKHADAYRELSLLLRRPPGREAYPGDIFYLHSRLLERACRLNEENGGGSLTALPVVETQRGNVAGYIPTNLISITDGQILLDSELFNRGIKPAIDAGISVSRVGGAAQVPAMRQLAANLRLELAQYEEVARFARFGTEVDESTQMQIHRGERWRTLLLQPPHKPMPLSVQIMLFVAAVDGQFDEIALSELQDFETNVVDFIQNEHLALLNHIERTGELAVETRHEILEIVSAFRQSWLITRSSG